MKNVLIGGIGNVLLSDDGVGPYVAQLLGAQYEFEDGVEVVDLGTPALDLVDHISGRDAVILIDAVTTEATPGTVLLYRKADIVRQMPAVRMDPHSPALVETLASVELFGVAPPDVLLVGITVESYETGCTLSTAVKASLARIVGEVLRELDRLGVNYTRKQQRVDPSIWWTAAEQLKSHPDFRDRAAGDRLEQPRLHGRNQSLPNC